MKIKNLPKHERPREKLIERGPTGLRDKELLAIILRTGFAGHKNSPFPKGGGANPEGAPLGAEGDSRPRTNSLNAIELAEQILRKFPMKKLLAMSYADMLNIKGIDSGKACSLLAAFELTKRALDVEDNNLPTINSAKEALAHLQELRTAKKEHFVVLYLNARNQLIHKETISVGTLNASLVHPREVFKPAIDHLAAGIIVAHNHPSGGTEPSEADIMLTGRLADAGKLLGIEVSDHLIITTDNCQSIL